MSDIILKSVALTNKSKNVAGHWVVFDENGECNATKSGLAGVVNQITRSLPVAVIYRDAKKGVVPTKVEYPDGDLNPGVDVVDTDAIAEAKEQAQAREAVAAEAPPAVVPEPSGEAEEEAEPVVEEAEEEEEAEEDPEPVQEANPAKAPKPKSAAKKPKAAAKKANLVAKSSQGTKSIGKKSAASIVNPDVDMLG